MRVMTGHSQSQCAPPHVKHSKSSIALGYQLEVTLLYLHAAGGALLVCFIR